MPIQLQDIIEARRRIQSSIQVTPISVSRSCAQLFGSETFLKYENEQTTGSFKIRGSLNKILGLTAKERDKGIIASSAGNHAQGVAFSAQKVGAKAHIVMPESSPIVKVLATQSYGAEVILHGRLYDESYTHACELEKKHGYTLVHAFDDDAVIAGQGTLGLEILEAVPELDSIVIPIGGGGLIAGVATAVKAIRPSIKIYGVVSEVSPAMKQMFEHVKPDPPNSILTIADGIAVKKPSERMYKEYIARLVDDVVAVNDDQIAEAIVYFLERAKTVVEGSAAATWAGAKKAGWNLGEKTCLLLSGGNIDLNLISKVIERGLSQKGRLIRVTVVVQDRPGNLNRLTGAIAATSANILDVKHDRVRPGLKMSETAIEFLLETRSESHANELKEAFRTFGARLIE
jgi:threonine dehydratase